MLDGESETYHTYDAAGNRTAQHVVVGSVLRSSYFQYDRVNRTMRSIAADGGNTYFGYDLAGNQTLVTDPVGRPTYTAYDQLNRTYCRYDAQLDKTYWNYDARSSVTRELDPEGRAVYMGYDPARRLAHQSNALGEFSYFFYDARGQRTHVLNPRGYSTYWRYDLLGRNTHREHALGGVSYMGYDAVGNVVLNEGPEESNFLGLYYVPVAGTSIKRVEPDGTDDATVLSGESGLGPIALDLNSPGGKLYWAGFQFVKRANLDGSGEMTIIGSGDLDTPGGITVDVNGGRIYFGDEGSGGLKSANLDGTNVQTLRTPGTVRGLAVDPAGGKVYYTASDSGQLRRMNLDGTGDALLVGSLLDPWGVALDLLNQKVYWVDRDTNNHIRKANLDGSSPTTVLSSLGGPFEVAVDPIRDRIYWTEGDTSVLKSAKLDGTGTTTVISGTVGGIALSVPVRVALSTFDGLRRATHVRDALMNVTYMGYDNRSSMVRRVDADGRATYMAYDTAQRLERQWHKTGVAGESDTSPSYYVYNQASEVTIVDDRLAGLGVSYFDYDKVGRVTKKTTATGAVYYAYDASGMKTSLKDPDLQENVYVFDAAGRLTREQVAAGRTAYLAYDKSGLVTRRASPGNVVVAYYSYDVAGRLKQQENKFMSSANALLSYYAFNRNANGAQTWVRNEENDNTYYEYDRLDRLAREFRLPTGTDQDYDNYYAFDAVGNRYLKINATLNQRSYYRYDTRNLLQQEWNKDAPETTYFTYDKAGRMSTQKIAGGQSSYFGYDQRNQVTAMGFAKAASPDSAQYLSYNGVGERVSLKVGNGASEDMRFAYDGRKLLVEKNAATGGTTDRRYRHNMSVLDDKGSGVELETSGGSRRYFAWAPDGTLRNFVLDFGGGEFLENAFIRDLFGVQIYAAAGIGGNSGKLQYLSPVMIDLGLTNVQINCLGANGWLAKQGVPLELAGLPGGGQDPRDLPVGLGLPTAEELALFQLFWKWAVGSAWTLLAVPIGDGTVPPVPFPPPRSAPPPLRAGVCGPDITEWFMEEVTLWTTYALRVDATIPNSELFVMLLLGPLPKHRELRVTSARNVCPAGCQTSTGEEAVTLCNRCVGVSDLGNFVYGAMGGVIGVPWALIRPGINIGGILDPVDRHLTTMPQDVASTERGWDLMTSVDGRAALAGGRAAFCQFLAGDAADWVTMQRPAGHCTACNQSIVPANAPHSTFPPRGALSPRNLPLDALFPVIQRTTTPTKLQGP